MLSFEESNALGQIIDTTWGRSSTNPNPTMSVKMRMSDEDVGLVTYTTVVTFQGNLQQHELQQQLSVGEQAIDAYLKEVRKQFKTETGRTLKLKLINLEPVVEQIDINTFSPLRAVRTAYYKCHGTVEVG